MYASRMTRKLYSVGNSFFAAPEAGTQVYSTSADVYSFGALTFITLLNASGLQTELNNARELGGKTFLFHRAYSLFKNKINAPQMLSFIESCTQMNPALRPSSREALISLVTALTDTDFSNLAMAMSEVDISTHSVANDDMSDEDMTVPPPTYIFGIELQPKDIAAIQAKSMKNEHVGVDNLKVFRGVDLVSIDVLYVRKQLPQHPTRETKKEFQKLIKQFLADCRLPTSRQSEKNQKKLKYQLFPC